jgi:hypothetical protein
MMSEFAQDIADQEQLIRAAFDERPGKAVKIRIQPMILRNGNYSSWKQVRWTLDCDTVTEALAIRDAMRTFFEAMARCGPAAVGAALAKLVKEAAA